MECAAVESGAKMLVGLMGPWVEPARVAVEAQSIEATTCSARRHRGFTSDFRTSVSDMSLSPGCHRDRETP